MRPATAHDRRDPSRGSARRGEPGQLVPGPGLLADARTARALDHHEALAVGRPHRVVVEGGLGRQALRFAATPSVGAHFLDVAPPVAPGDVGDPLPVRRPGGHLLVHRVAREATRHAAREVYHVHLVQRAEGESPAVRGRRGIADLLDENVPRVHPGVESHQRSEVLVHVGGERDGTGLPRGHVHAPDLPAVGDHERLRVGGEGGARHQVARETGFLVVALHRVDEPLLVPRGEVPQPQSRLGVVARGIHQPFAIRGQHRTHRAPVQIGLRKHLPRLTVVDRELPQRKVQVVAEAPAVARIPHVTRVGTECRPERVVRGAASRGTGRRPLVLLRETGPGPAILVVQPDLVGAADRHAGLGCHDVVAVRRPLRRGKHALVAFRDRARVGPIGVAHPDVFRARAIGQEHDLLAVGRVAGLRVERGSRGDPLRFAPGERQRIEVAQELEHERLSVGRHIEGDPGPLRCGEIDGARRLQGEGVRPLGGEGQARDGGGEERRGEAPTHHCTPGWRTTACRERRRKPGGPDYTRQARVLTNDARPAIIHPER